MSGRYGSDQFNIFLVVLTLILLLLYVFFIKEPFLVIIIWLVLLYYLFRTYSRNIYRRRQENEKFLSLIFIISLNILNHPIFINIDIACINKIQHFLANSSKVL